MRIRTIKPEWLDDDIVLATDAARVMSVCLILLADDQGRGRFVPQAMASRIFPGDPEKFPGALAELSRMGFVLLYEAGGRRYWQVRNWDKHQRVDKPANPRLPAPLDDSPGTFATLPGIFSEPSRLTPIPIPTKIPTPTKRKREPKPKKLQEMHPVISEHRRLLRQLHSIDVGDLPPERYELACAKALQQSWGEEWPQALAFYVGSNDDWFKREGWPLSLAKNNLSKLTARWKIQNGGARKTTQQIQAEAAEYDAMLERRMLEAESVP